MGTQLAQRSSGGYLATNDDFYAALASEASNLKGGDGGKAFMKFDGNDGSYSYGADDEPLKNGTQMAANLRSYKRGWVIWKAGAVVHEEMVALADGAQPEKRDLPDHGPYGEDDGPVEQYTIDFKLIRDPFVEMIFQANNVSKRRALAAFLKDFGGKFRNHPGEVPIIELSSREFEGKTKSGRKVTKYAPEFKIVDWMSEEELLALSGGSPDDYADDKTAKLEDKRASRRGDDEDDRPRSRKPRDEQEEDAPRTRRAVRDEAEDEAPRSRKPRDEPEDEAPRTRRPARDEEDEAPRARRAARDEAEDDAPRSRKPAAPADDEDERPARRTRREEPADDADERPARRSARDEDEDDAPRTRRPARDEDEREERTDRPSGRDRGRF